MKKTLLLDVNVWIALALDSHVHHPQAQAWAASAGDAELAFCRVTQQGYLRLLTNQRVMGPFVLTPEQAWTTYDQTTADRRVVFVSEPTGLEAEWRRLTGGRAGSLNIWTDAYLAAFARCGGLEVVTLDRGFAQFNDVDCTIIG